MKKVEKVNIAIIIILMFQTDNVISDKSFIFPKIIR